jgi:hypothetical protein
MAIASRERGDGEGQMPVHIKNINVGDHYAAGGQVREVTEIAVKDARRVVIPTRTLPKIERPACPTRVASRKWGSANVLRYQASAGGWRGLFRRP